MLLLKLFHPFRHGPPMNLFSIRSTNTTAGFWNFVQKWNTCKKQQYFEIFWTEIFKTGLFLHAYWHFLVKGKSHSLLSR